MKRGTSIAAVLATAALAMSGCAMGGGSSGGDAAAPEAPTGEDISGEITVWSWDVAAVALERLGEEFAAEHEDVKINVVDTGYDNAYDKISVGLQAGTGLPDMITIETDVTQGYITEFPDGFVNLTPSFGEYKDDFDPFKWAVGTAEDGDLRVAPWDSGTVALYYRADYFDEAGIDPGSFETWDELVAVGEEIKEKTGHTLISADLTGSGLFQMLLQQQGKGVFNEDGDIDLQSPEAVQVLTLIKDLNDKGLVKNVKGWDARVTSAKDGDSSVTPEAVWWIGTLEGDAPELSGTYGVRPLPTFNDGGAKTSNSGGSGLAIPSQAKNPELAAAFMKYVLADAENQVSMMENEGLFPSFLPALDNEFFKQPSEYFDGQEVYETFAELTAEIPPIHFTSDSAMANDILGNMVSSVVLSGADPETALKDAATQLANGTGRQIAD